MPRPQVWQIATGDQGRDYSWLFLKYDIMAVADKKIWDDAEAERKLKRFNQGPKIGDIVLMRRVAGFEKTVWVPSAISG